MSSFSKSFLSVTNGGRALNAIWNSPLPKLQKLVLMFLGSQVDFNGTFTEFRWHSIELITKMTSMSRASVFAALKRLEQAHYIERQQNSQNHLKTPTSYALTVKVFEEYAALLDQKEAAIYAEKQAQENHQRAQQQLFETSIKSIFDRCPIPGKDSPGDGLGCPGDGLDSPGTGHTLPSKLPSKLPNDLFTQNAPAPKEPAAPRKQEDQAEARRIIAMVFKPSGSYRGAAGFYDRDAAYGAADEVLARHGIDALRAFKDESIKLDLCGKVALNVTDLLNYLTRKGAKTEGQSRTSAP